MIANLGAPKSQRNCDCFDCNAPISEPQKSLAISETIAKECCITIHGCDGKLLAICDFELRFLKGKNTYPERRKLTN